MAAWILAALAGLVGVLYGLLERSKRQAAEEDANHFKDANLKLLTFTLEETNRYEALIGLLRNKVEKLQKDLNANVPRDQLLGRVNELLRWGVHQEDSAPSDSSGVQTPPSP